MNCPQCGGDNPAAAKFCRSCGAHLGLICPGCSHRNPPDSRFCVECGDPLAAPATRGDSPAAYTPRHLAERILASRSALEGEIKQTTVMFCDLCDSTGLAERLGPEGMHELLDRFFERAMGAVHRYEGTINQFLGDGFMALFGAPLALEDHPRRALFSAIDIRRALAESPLVAHVDVQMRIGINSGSVVVGKIGDDLRTDYTAVGDVTNVAARLQHLATPGEIVVGEATRRLVGDAARFESMGAVDLRGKSTPVEAYRVLSLGPRRSPLRETGERPLTPFVGREREMRAVEEALASVERRQGMVVGVVGEPGIGKSRLVLEFRRALSADRVTYLESRCLPFTQSVPYALVMDLLRANCGIADTDTPEEAAGKVRFGLAEVGLVQEERATALLALLGLKETPLAVSPEALKRRTFDTLRLMALRGSQRRPLVFALEDLHWTDRISEEFFAELVESIAEVPLLLLTTFRPGYSPPWSGRANAMQIALRALSPEESVAVVTAAAGGTGTAASAIAERGGGNPLFLEELARAVTDTGRSGAIPETIQGIIAARIDRLGEQPKRLLQIASVIGREFSPDLLEAVWDGARPIDPWLRELMRADFIYEHLGEEQEHYVFRHALTHDVAYGSLLERQRRTWHGAIGVGLERQHASATTAVVELLAHHFGLSGDDDRAIDYAIAAGEKAQRRWAHAEALQWFDAALARLEGRPESRGNALRRLDAVLKQSEVRFALGQHTEQLEALEALRLLVENTADPARQAAWHYWVGFLHSLTGSRPAIAIEHCERAVAIARDHGVEGIEAYAQSCLAQVCLFTGALRRGLEVGEHAVAAFETRGERWWAGRTLGHLSPIANALGEWERAEAYGRRALDHATALDDQRLKIMALARIASTLIQRGEGAGGLQLCDAADTLQPGPFDAMTVRAMRGYGLVKVGELSDGTALLEEVVAWLDRSRLRYTHCQISLWLVDAYLAAGARARAIRILEAALESAGEIGYRHLESVAHRWFAAAIGPSSAARAHLEREAELLREMRDIS